jgi:hypothetical protein
MLLLDSCVVMSSCVATHVSVVWHHVCVCVALRMYVCAGRLVLYQNFFTDVDVVDVVCRAAHH